MKTRIHALSTSPLRVLLSVLVLATPLFSAPRPVPFAPHIPARNIRWQSMLPRLAPGALWDAAAAFPPSEGHLANLRLVPGPEPERIQEEPKAPRAPWLATGCRF
jgi:hypothetical protein